MKQLDKVRQDQQGQISEAERIYSDEAISTYFSEIQKLRKERDTAIEKAILKLSAEYDEKIRKVEENHGMLLVLTKDRSNGE